MSDDFMDFLDKNIGRCEFFVLFCSKNALESDLVKQGWEKALKIKEKIIPIFIDKRDIPSLLSTKLGVHFIEEDVEKTINNLYYLITKKLNYI